MKTYLLGLCALTFGIVTMTVAEPRKPNPETPTEQTRPVTTAKETPTPDGKRLPGRDCKLYEGDTRQHRFPQYETGNPNRPECK